MATVMETINAYSRESSRKASDDETRSDTPARAELMPNEQIAVLAYFFWQERGCPDGSPEIDWFRAEEHLQSAASEGDSAPAPASVLSAK